MKDYLISSYIDDELDLDEKIEFVETVHAQVQFKDEAVDLLHQEKQLRHEVVERVPAVVIPEKRPFLNSLWRPAGLFAAGLAAALLVMFFVTPRHKPPGATKYRFVLYQPNVKQVEITGSFLGWAAVPMHKSRSLTCRPANIGCAILSRDRSGFPTRRSPFAKRMISAARIRFWPCISERENFVSDFGGCRPWP